jgi:hypothetical protein
MRWFWFQKSARPAEETDIGEFSFLGGNHANSWRHKGPGTEMKLVEILLERGLIAPAQVRSVAGYQNLEDQQLATCLFEGGLLSADQLASALSVLYGVPPALDRDFICADPGLRKRLGAHKAENLAAIPLYTTPKRRVAVAMVNPTHPQIIEELGFVLGAAIEPMVTSEPVLAHQLEVLYSMPRRRTTGFHPVSSPPPDSAYAAQAPLLDGDNHVRRPTQSYLDAVSDMPLFVPADSCAPVQTIDDAIVPNRPRVSSTGPDAAVELILSATDRQAAADRLFAFMRSCFGAGAMFVINGVFAEGRFGYNEGSPCPGVERLVFSLSLPSCFHVSYNQGVVFLGPPSSEGKVVHQPLWAALGCQPPREVLVAPVVVAERTAMLLYAQGREGGRIEKFVASRLEHVCAALGNTLVRLSE